jgi:[CysO sulfur-carrier protein]-S-L-cysteine hydrolase
MSDRVRQPWALGNLVLPESLLEAVHEEARRAYVRDEESCGLLVGKAEEPLALDGIVPMKNRANALHVLDPDTYPRTGRMYFDIDPLAFERHVKTRAAEGRPAKVLYHSHLDAGAYFSETDAAATTMGGNEPAYDLAYLVTSVRKGGVIAEHALFVWEPATRAFVQTDLRVDPEGPKTS